MLKRLLILKAAGGGGSKNLLVVSTENAMRVDAGYDNFTEKNKVVYITEKCKGGYKATIKTNTEYTVSFEPEPSSSDLHLRVWINPTSSSLGEQIVNDYSHNSHDFTVTDGEDKEITAVCGFYCTSGYGQQNPVIRNFRLVEKN